MRAVLWEHPEQNASRREEGSLTICVEMCRKCDGQYQPRDGTEEQRKYQSEVRAYVATRGINLFLSVMERTFLGVQEEQRPADEYQRCCRRSDEE